MHDVARAKVLSENDVLRQDGIRSEYDSIYGSVEGETVRDSLVDSHVENERT